MDNIVDPQLQELIDELERRKTHVYNTYVPDDNVKRNQLGFHCSTKWLRCVFGGNRSGKSKAAAHEIGWWLTGQHPYQQIPPPKNRIWVISVEYRTLYEGIWLHLKEILPPWEIKKIGPKIQGHDIPSYVEMENESRVDFISAIGGEDTRRKIQAAQIDLLVIDEEIDGELWTELQFRLVSKGGRGVIAATLVQSEDWLVDIENEVAATPNHPDIDIFRFDTTHNKYNDQAAFIRIKSRLSYDEQLIRIEGRSRRTQGLVFNTWNSAIHEVDDYDIPDDWERIMVLDTGFRICAALWIAISPQNKWVGYQEMYLHEASLHEVATEIYRLEEWEHLGSLYGPKKPITYRIIDPAAYSTLQDGSPSLALQLSNSYALDFNKANNDWRSGIEAARRLLLVDTGGQPQFTLFKSCVNFIRERLKYRLNPDRRKLTKDSAIDRPIKRNDHLMDCYRYAANSEYLYATQPMTEQQLIEEAYDPFTVIRSRAHEFQMKRLRRLYRFKQ